MGLNSKFENLWRGFKKNAKAMAEGHYLQSLTVHWDSGHLSQACNHGFLSPPFPPPLGRNGEEILPGGNFGDE